MLKNGCFKSMGALQDARGVPGMQLPWETHPLQHKPGQEQEPRLVTVLSSTW